MKNPTEELTVHILLILIVGYFATLNMTKGKTTKETALCGEKYEGNKKIMCNCYALRTQYFAGNGEINGRIGQIGEVAGVNAYPDREPLCTPENGNLYFPYCESADFPQISGLYRCNGLPMGCGRPERPRPPRPCGRGNNCCCLYLLLLLLL